MRSSCGRQGALVRAEGRAGYNVPSLYGLALGAPYLHHGQAPSLTDLFTERAWQFHTNAGNANFSLHARDAGKVDDLVAFLLVDRCDDARDRRADDSGPASASTPARCSSRDVICPDWISRRRPFSGPHVNSGVRVSRVVSRSVRSGARQRRSSTSRRSLLLRRATSAVRPGVTTSVTSVASARPPITATASGRCSSAPAPMPSASGARPASVAAVVIRIGRRRRRAAATSACSSGTPPRRRAARARAAGCRS